ncbi:hypothetical protein GCM10009795_004590 [Nocardioides hankookensis]
MAKTRTGIRTDTSSRHPGPGGDPKHVFLDARAVMHRYNWGKTRGYRNLKDRSLVPPPAVTHPDRWRLDQLMAWEERGVSVTEPTEPDTIERLLNLLPQPKRAPRRSA